MEDWFSFVWIYSKDAYTLTKNPYKSLFLFGKCMQPKPWKLKLLPPFIGLMRSTDFFFLQHQLYYINRSMNILRMAHDITLKVAMPVSLWTNFQWHITQSLKIFSLSRYSCGWVSSRRCGHVVIAFGVLELPACLCFLPNANRPTSFHVDIYMVGRKHLWGHRWYRCICQLPTG